MEYPRLVNNYPVHVYETGPDGQDFEVRYPDGRSIARGTSSWLITNNARYLKWVTNSYDLDFILNNVPLSAEINYLAESRFNESIAILCRVRISWKKNHL